MSRGPDSLDGPPVHNHCFVCLFCFVFMPLPIKRIRICHVLNDIKKQRLICSPATETQRIFQILFIISLTALSTMKLCSSFLSFFLFFFTLLLFLCCQVFYWLHHSEICWTNFINLFYFYKQNIVYEMFPNITI